MQESKSGLGPFHSAVAALIEKLFRYPASSVDFETTADDVNGWDSLSHTMFILEVERHFDIVFDPYRMAGFRCVGDLLEEVRRIKA